MSREMRNQRPHDKLEEEGDGDNQFFMGYKDRAFQLCRRLLWPSYPAESIHVGRIQGGASHRILSVRVARMDSIPDLGPREKLDLPPGDYILRIPLHDHDDFEHVKAVHRFVRSRISFGVPTVVDFDASNRDDNPLGRPYILQHRIPGERLDKIWPALKYTQQLLVTLDIARLYTELMGITNASGGIPDMERGPAADGTLRTTSYGFPSAPPASRETLEPQPPAEMLHRRLVSRDPGDPTFTPCLGAAEMVRHMQTTSRIFGSEGEGPPLYYLNHGGLCPQKIMVQASGENAAFVSGILGWDEAHFAPAVVSFSPPAWMWMPGCPDKRGWPAASKFLEASPDKHGDAVSREIKALFDAVVGPEFSRHAYSPDACLARKIWAVAYEADGRSWVRREVEKTYGEWKACRGGSIQS